MAEAYDPNAIEDQPKSAHMSRKDLRVLAIAGVVLVILMIPVYIYMKENRDRHVCKANLGQVFKAMGLYLEANNDRYPPMYVVGEKGEPNLFDGSPYTWMSLIHEGMSQRNSFLCPSAHEGESVKNLHPDPEKPTFQSSYGIYSPWATWNSTMIIAPNTSVLVAETSNNGSRQTHDPLPFSHGVDGIVIGWDNQNAKPNADSETVTRLAFPDSKGAKFVKGGPGRHNDGIFVLFASGTLGFLKPESARIQRIGTEIVGRWATR